GCSHGGQRLAAPVADRGQLERLGGDLAQQLVRGGPLSLGPQLSQERAGLAPREPGVPESLAEVGPQLRLERPRAKILRSVEALVDVAEVIGGRRLDLR